MKKLITLIILLLCALPLASSAQDRMFGSGIDPKCYDAANKAADSLKKQNLPDSVVQKKFQEYLAQCSGANPVTSGFMGALNVEYFRLARMVVGEKIQPDLYV